jgi:hypothetical protein
VIDVRALEASHVGNEAVCRQQLVVGGLAHRGFAVPAEGFQGLRHELFGLRRRQAAGRLGLLDECQRARREDVPARQDLLHFRAQRRIFDQLEP